MAALQCLVACVLQQGLVPPPTGERDEDARKIKWLAQIGDAVLKTNAPFLGEGQLAKLRDAIARLPPNAPPAQAAQLRTSYGDQLRAVGEIDAAIEQYQFCVDLASKLGDEQNHLAQLRKLAFAWLRKGERANCITRHNQDSCIYPLRGGAIHVDQQGSSEAVRLYEQILREDFTDYGSMWLLNVAHMTLGDWPAGVPPQWLMRSGPPAPTQPLPRLQNVAPELGLDTFNRAGAGIMDDFTGDGLLDIVTTSMGPLDRMHFFEQQPDRTFKEVAEQKKLAGQLGGLQAFVLDANNDGRLDLLVMRGAWLGQFGEMPESLLIQQPDGTFADRTQSAGIEICAPSQVAAMADVDLDGDVDLFLGYEGTGGAHDPYPSRLFLNRGDGTFEDATARSGIKSCGFVKGAVFGDYDGDRYPDLYVSNLRGANQLWRNKGDGTFEDVALKLGVADPIESFACWFFDWNNDGWLDLYVANYSQTERMNSMGSFYRNGTTGADVNRLYQNDGHGGFKDVTRDVGLLHVNFPMGANFGDLDNDGWPDLYLGTGDPSFQSLWPNVFFHNVARPDGSRGYEDATTATGTGHLQKGHGVAWGDWDDDGDQDLFEQMGGAYRDDAFWDVLYENPGFGNHWITVRVIGRKSNRCGLGARIRAHIVEPDGERDVFHFVGANSSFGGNSLQAEMGLGKATKLARLEVYWPATNVTQQFDDAPLDSIVVVDEGSEKLTIVPPRPRAPPK